MFSEVEEVSRRVAAVIGVSSLIFGGEGVNRRFAAVIGVSSLIFKVGEVNRRFAAVIGVSSLIFEGEGVSRRSGRLLGEMVSPFSGVLPFISSTSTAVLHCFPALRLEFVFGQVPFRASVLFPCTQFCFDVSIHR